MFFYLATKLNYLQIGHIFIESTTVQQYYHISNKTHYLTYLVIIFLIFVTCHCSKLVLFVFVLKKEN